MKTSLLFLISLLITMLIACKPNEIVEEKSITINGSFTLEVDDPGPPPPVMKSNFINMESWLTSIIANEKPTRAIATYNIGVFEGQNTYTLCLTGLNTYDISPNHQQEKIEFSPTEMYFLLPQNEFKGLTRAQLFTKLTVQLQEFISSNKFKNSFFADAKSIETSWAGEIWTKK
jgi:hypothetical protein